MTRRQLLLLVALLFVSLVHAAVKRPREPNGAAHPPSKKAELQPQFHDPDAGLEDDDACVVCLECQGRVHDEDPDPPGSFLQVQARHNRALRRNQLGASLQAAATTRTRLSANAILLLEDFRNVANAAVGGAVAGYPNIHYLRSYLRNPVVTGATAAALTGPGAWAIAGAAGPKPAALPVAPIVAGSFTAAHFPKFAAVGATVTYDGWVYTMDLYGRITQAQGFVDDFSVLHGGRTSPNLRRYVNAIGKVAGPVGKTFAAGHIRAKVLGGKADLINFIPQDPATNSGVQCSLEITLAQLARNHVDHQLTLTLAYGAGGVNFYKPTNIRFHAVSAAGPVAGWALNNVVDIQFPNP